MGIEQRQGPIYIFASQSKAYRDGMDRIFGKKKAKTETKTAEKPAEKKPAAKRSRGRPKGSKNKATLEKESKLRADAMEQSVKTQSY